MDADAALLNQAFLNLVSNALRHAEPRSELRFALRAEGETALLSVCSALRRGEKPDVTVYVYDQLGRLVPDYPCETVDGEDGRVFKLELKPDHCAAIVRKGV